MSALVSWPRTSRARGPHSPIVVYADVQVDDRPPTPSAGMRSENHFLSTMPWAPPVTTRNRSCASRITVRSERNPPRASSTGV